MKKILVIGFCALGLGFFGCSGGKSGGSNLSAALAGNTFEVQGINEILSLLSDCSDGGSSPDIEATDPMDPDEGAGEEDHLCEEETYATEDEDEDEDEEETVSLEEPGTADLKKKATGNEYTIIFSDLLFVLKQGTETVMNGSWKASDGNTIKITVEGETIPLDVEVVGSTLMTSLPVGTSFSCASDGSGGN